MEDFKRQGDGSEGNPIDLDYCINETVIEGYLDLVLNCCPVNRSFRIEDVLLEDWHFPNPDKYVESKRSTLMEQLHTIADDVLALGLRYTYFNHLTPKNTFGYINLTKIGEEARKHRGHKSYQKFLSNPPLSKNEKLTAFISVCLLLVSLAAFWISIEGSRIELPKDLEYRVDSSKSKITRFTELDGVR